jgi:hypothetical protein
LAVAGQLPGEDPANIERLVSTIENSISQPSLADSKAISLVRDMHALMTRLKLNIRRVE